MGGAAVLSTCDIRQFILLSLELIHCSLELICGWGVWRDGGAAPIPAAPRPARPDTTGHQNHKQKIQHTMRIKEENDALKRMHDAACDEVTNQRLLVERLTAQLERQAGRKGRL